MSREEAAVSNGNASRSRGLSIQRFSCSQKEMSSVEAPSAGLSRIFGHLSFQRGTSASIYICLFLVPIPHIHHTNYIQTVYISTMAATDGCSQGRPALTLILEVCLEKGIPYGEYGLSEVS